MRIILFPVGHTPNALSAAPFGEMSALFLVDLGVAGRRPLTCKRHAGELRRFGAWLDIEKLVWNTVTDLDLAAFLRTRAHLSPSSRAATVGALRGFYSWGLRQRRITSNPATELISPRREKPTPKALTRAQLRCLMAELERESSLRAQRDAALTLTGLYTGLRASELANLCWSDIDLDAGTLIVVLSKMGHGRAVGLHVDLVDRLREWKHVQGLNDSAPCFANVRSGASITAARVGKIVRGIGRASGIDELHTHCLRHSFATWTLRESKDLYAVSKALGHKALAQTEVYIPAAADVEQIAEAVGQLPGMADW